MLLSPKQDYLNNGSEINIKKIWTTKKISQLLELSEQYEQNWILISRKIKDFNSEDCFFKYKQLISNYENSDWTKEEDNQLTSLVKNKSEIN